MIRTTRLSTIAACTKVKRHWMYAMAQPKKKLNGKKFEARYNAPPMDDTPSKGEVLNIWRSRDRLVKFQNTNRNAAQIWSKTRTESVPTRL